MPRGCLYKVMSVKMLLIEGNRESDVSRREPNAKQKRKPRQS